MSDRLDRMRTNPAGDWVVSDIEFVCREHGIRCTPPSGGSHCKVSHPSRRDILTTEPTAGEAVYIRKLVRFIDAVIQGKPDA